MTTNIFQEDLLKIFEDPKTDNLTAENAIGKIVDYYSEINDETNLIKYVNIGLAKNISEVVLPIADFYERQQKYTEMIKYLEIGVLKDNKNALNYLGCHYYEMKDYEKAKHYLLKACVKECEDAYYNLGVFYGEMKQPVNMKKWLTKSIVAGFDNALEALINYYQTNNKQGELINFILTTNFDIKRIKKFITYDEFLKVLLQYKNNNKIQNTQ